MVIGNRKLPITEQRRRLRIIVHELSADLLALVAEQYEDAVRSAKEFLQTQKPERRTASPSQSWRDDAESCIHAMSSLVLEVEGLVAKRQAEMVDFLAWARHYSTS